MAEMRRIVHIDMDAFYAAIEQRDGPQYRGRPVVVGADPKRGRGRGVVSTASYEARPFGVHSAMPISQAYRLCPQAIFLPVRMAHYHQVSERIFAIFERYTDVVEPLSIDEAFLDVTTSTRLFGTVEEIARCIKQDIRRDEGLVASVGVAPNKFLAKLASDLSKPDGFLVLDATEVESFVRDLPVSRLWGVGKHTAHRLEALGLRTIGQVAQWSETRLSKRFGSLGTHIWRLAHGLDDRPVTSHREPQSIGAETTFAEDTDDVEALHRTLLELADKVGQRLRAKGWMTTKVTLKYRDAAFATLTRTQSLAEPTAVAMDLYDAVSRLLSQLPTARRKVRLLGITVAELTPLAQSQLSLFAEASHKRLQAERAEDAIRARFGPQAITRAALLNSKERRAWHDSATTWC